MRVSFGDYEIELRAWNSQQEVKRYLESLHGSAPIFGEDAENPSQFHTARVYLSVERAQSPSSDYRFGIGLVSQIPGLAPLMLLLPDQDSLIFGLESEVVCVSVRDRAVKFQVPSACIVYSLLPFPELDRILVIHEIGAMGLTYEGQKIWEHAPDLKTGSVIDGNILRLTFDLSPSIAIDISTGAARQVDET